MERAKPFRGVGLAGVLGPCERKKPATQNCDRLPRAAERRGHRSRISKG